MAHKFLLNATQRGLLVNYYQNIHAVQALVRSFASQGGRDWSCPDSKAAAVALETNDESKPLTVELPMGLLGPMDMRLPLPGNLGLDRDLSAAGAGIRRKNFSSPASGADSLPPNAVLLSKTDLLTAQTNHDRHVDAFRQFFAAVDQATSAAEQVRASSAEVEQAPFELECSARNCSKRMKREFAPLFPDRKFAQDNMTVLALSQRTSHDMSAWSEGMDNEREELTVHFISLAKEICEQLKEAGHWADFIDPSSCQPYFGAHTNDTLAETDDRMRYLGLDVQDMGCCKVVFHPQWKAHVFVGCLFTNAPLDDPLIQELLKKADEVC